MPWETLRNKTQQAHTTQNRNHQARPWRRAHLAEEGCSLLMWANLSVEEALSRNQESLKRNPSNGTRTDFQPQSGDRHEPRVGTLIVCPRNSPVR